MSKQINEHAFETQVEETLLGVSGWQAGTNAEWDVERALFPARCALSSKRHSRSFGARCAGCMPIVWRSCSSPLSSRSLISRERCMYCGTASSSTAYFPARYIQARARAQRRGSVALPAEPPHDHPSGALPPGKARHGGPAVRAERSARGDMRAKESRHWPELASCGAPVPGASRSARTAFPLQSSCVGALCRRPR